MANANTPFGLSPVANLIGSPWTGAAKTFFIAQSDPNAYAIGDPLTLAGGSDGNGVPTVTLATAGASHVILGPMVGTGGTVYGGAFVDPNSTSSTVIPATKTKGYYVDVVVDPDALFVIQEGGAGPALTSAVGGAGRNFNLVSGANNGFVSGWQFDDTTGTTAATGQIQLVGLLRTSDNAFGTYAKWVCRINQHQFNGALAGV